MITTSLAPLLLSTTLVAAAPPYRFYNLTNPALSARNTITGTTSTCTDESTLICSPDGLQFGLCSRGSAVMQAVASGTRCSNGQIVAVDDGDVAGSSAGITLLASSAAVVTVTSTAAAVTVSVSSSAMDTSAPAAAAVTSIAPAVTVSATSSPINASSASAQTIASPTKSALSEATSISAPASSSAVVWSSWSTSASWSTASPTFPTIPSQGPPYKTYLGNGSPEQGWPSQNAWVPTFAQLWTLNLPILSSSNSPAENAELHAALLATSAAATIDPRFALAIMMQESHGDLRVATTNYGVNNPGIFQSHNGTGTCYNTPSCPASAIRQMAEDGILGTPYGPGLKGILAEAKGVSAQRFYQAARMYNSGSVASSGMLQDGIATHAYASDVANRLVGWHTGLSTFAG